MSPRISLRRAAAFLFLGAGLLRLGAAEMTVDADLRDASRGLFHVTLTLPVQPGPLTLNYPKWIPGEHGPTGPIQDFSGIVMSAGGRPLPWRRDLVDMYALHVDIPAGVDRLQVAADYLGPTDGKFSAGPSSSAQLAVLNWHLILLAPHGVDAGTIAVRPSLTLPPGWKFGTAMDVAQQNGQHVEFKPLTLEMLQDQPVIAGANFKRFELTPGGSPAHFIDCAADSVAALDLSDERLAAYRRVPAEYAAVFGARHYETYHFLLALSDRTGYSGVEHHQCSDDRAPERSLIDDDAFVGFAGLLTHEYFHSWNGKHRRPARLMSPDFSVPMQGDLLWVYEGLTNYYGDVMPARVGLWTPDTFHEFIASIAASLANTPGRQWRPLQDTADAAQILYGAPRAWASRRRSVDYYPEGTLLWLDADVLIRTRTNGAKSLDDFARAFFGDGGGGPIDPAHVPGRKPTVVTYEADDVVQALNAVLPYDWRQFFAQRISAIATEPPMAGITGGGWKLIYTDTPNKVITAGDKSDKMTHLNFSLGLALNSESHEVLDVIPGSPAEVAGIGPGMKLIGVNGRKFNDDVFTDALKATKDGHALELLVENAEFLFTAKVNYYGGPRYPHLERVSGTADVMGDILKSRVK